MTQHFLDHFFNPQSIALIGASHRLGSLGAVLYRNLQDAGYLDSDSRSLMLVNPKYESLDGEHCYHDVEELAVAPELAIICSPPETIPGILKTLAVKGTHAVVILTAGTTSGDKTAATFKQKLLDAVAGTKLRIIGPNCIGIQSPHFHLNASFSHLAATQGSLAFVTQSGAMLTTVIDWARPHDIGFSHVLSLGDTADVDMADVLDYLANDSSTTAILLYIEAITSAERFMEAARVAARTKPIVAIKAGRSAAGAHAAASHTGMLAGVDAVYDAAFRRCGILRVDTMQELFAATETLALSKPLQGERIAILTNGGGPGVLAADALVAINSSGEPGATLATLQDETISKLNAVLPAMWSHGNPVDIIGDATPQRFRDALGIVLDDNNVDGLLVLNCPTAITGSMESASAVAPMLQQTSKPVFTCWLGGQTGHPARKLIRQHYVPSYDTPELAVQGIMHRIRFHRNQKLLSLAPARAVQKSSPIFCSKEKTESRWLSALKVNQLLNEFHISCIATYEVRTASEAQVIARKIGKPCVLKILSPDITHKSDVGGVALNLATPEAVHQAAKDMLERVQQRMPNARIDGLLVQEMIHRPDAYELIAGFHHDPAFGPVLLFGHGGVGVEVINDRALELPPLNELFARNMIDRTRIGKLLKGFRNQPAVAIDAIEAVLVQLSKMAQEHPEIVEMDINPLLADKDGVIAVDARIRVHVQA
ncbi:MAG TPA: acetate--CoA ligase family protein [Steroidobacteraceae bacterium]|nr:acetate--CoA ligase family protein [Steroidobacteraceae bacterium]